MLFALDQKEDEWKKYRIPRHANLHYSRVMHERDVRRYGENGDEYQRLVLGKHGEAAYSLIPRDQIKTEAYDFYRYNYNHADKLEARTFTDVFSRPPVPLHAEQVIAAIDTGFADPTIIQILWMDDKNVWRVFARYRMVRIPFPEQARVINWLDDIYNFSYIGIDYGAGGQGRSVGDMLKDNSPSTKNYQTRIVEAHFEGYMPNVEEGKTSTRSKSYAGEELARMLINHEIVFSELDAEGVSEISRVTYIKLPDGANKYHVMSEKGAGKSPEDHIFASFIVFVLSQLHIATRGRKREAPRLYGASWG